MKKTDRQLREEIRLLRLDLHEAHRRQDLTAICAIQEHLDGLEYINIV